MIFLSDSNDDWIDVVAYKELQSAYLVLNKHCIGYKYYVLGGSGKYKCLYVCESCWNSSVC